MDEKGRAFIYLAFCLYTPHMFLDDNPVGNGQSLSCALPSFLGGKEGFKNSILDILEDSCR